MIHQACLRGDVEAVNDILSNHPEVLDLTDCNGISYLYYEYNNSI